MQATWKQELRKIKDKVAAALPELPEDNADIQALIKDYQPCTRFDHVHVVADSVL